jgi:AcrR family transcriptional regulator
MASIAAPGKARAAIQEYVANESKEIPTLGRRRIMAAVLRLAVTKGYAGLSMRSIAKEVQMQAPSLYSHYPGGKDEVVMETLRSVYVEFLASVVAGVKPEDSVEQEFSKVVGNHLRFQMVNEWASLWETLVEADRAAGFLASETRDLVQAMRSLYANYVTALVEEIGTANNSETTAKLIIHILNAAPVWSASGRQEGSLGPLVQFTLEACRAVIFSHPTRVADGHP